MSRVEDRVWAIAMIVSGIVALVGFSLKLAHHLPAGTAWPGLAGLVCAVAVAARSWRATASKRDASWNLHAYPPRTAGRPDRLAALL